MKQGAKNKTPEIKIADNIKTPIKEPSPPAAPPENAKPRKSESIPEPAKTALQEKPLQISAAGKPLSTESMPRNSAETVKTSNVKSCNIKIAITQVEINPSMLSAFESELQKPCRCPAVMTGGSIKTDIIYSKCRVSLNTGDNIKKLPSVQNVTINLVI
jgi:hypothetical protein